MNSWSAGNAQTQRECMNSWLPGNVKIEWFTASGSRHVRKGVSQRQRSCKYAAVMAIKNRRPVIQPRSPI